MRRLIVIVALFCAACEPAHAPADNGVAANASAETPRDEVGLGGAVASSNPVPHQAEAPSTDTRPMLVFEHRFAPARNASRAAHEALSTACLEFEAQGCGVVASDVRVLDENDAFGEVTLEIERAHAPALSLHAVRRLQTAHSPLVQSRVYDRQSTAAPGAEGPSPLERVRLLFRFSDPRSGFERGFDRVIRNVGATAVVLIVIVGSVAPWLLLAWLIWAANRWLRRRKEAAKAKKTEAAAAAAKAASEAAATSGGETTAIA